eukprot:ANDGO_01774.mRNA.1 U3 small nucleolar RNA-associated protein 6
MASQGVRRIIEATLPHLAELCDRGLFSGEEVKQVIATRTRLEHKILGKVKPLVYTDFVRLLQYELRLESLRKLRSKRLFIAKKHDSDYAFVRRIVFTFERFLKKFPLLPVFQSYAQFSKRVGARSALSRLYGRLVQAHPTSVDAWMEAGKCAWESLSDPQMARRLFLRGLKMVGGSEEHRVGELWTEYVKFELLYAQFVARSIDSESEDKIKLKTTKTRTSRKGKAGRKRSRQEMIAKKNEQQDDEDEGEGEDVEGKKKTEGNEDQELMEQRRRIANGQLVLLALKTLEKKEYENIVSPLLVSTLMEAASKFPAFLAGPVLAHLVEIAAVRARTAATQKKEAWRRGFMEIVVIRHPLQTLEERTDQSAAADDDDEQKESTLDSLVQNAVENRLFREVYSVLRARNDLARIESVFSPSSDVFDVAVDDLSAAHVLDLVRIYRAEGRSSSAVEILKKVLFASTSTSSSSSTSSSIPTPTPTPTPTSSTRFSSEPALHDALSMEYVSLHPTDSRRLFESAPCAPLFFATLVSSHSLQSSAPQQNVLSDEVFVNALALIMKRSVKDSAFPWETEYTAVSGAYLGWARASGGLEGMRRAEKNVLGMHAKQGVLSSMHKGTGIMVAPLALFAKITDMESLFDPASDHLRMLLSVAVQHHGSDSVRNSPEQLIGLWVRVVRANRAVHKHVDASNAVKKALAVLTNPRDSKRFLDTVNMAS